MYQLITYPHPWFFLLFFFSDPSTTEIYTLSLHDALPICFDQERGTATTIGLIDHFYERRAFCAAHATLNRPLEDRKSTRLNSSHRCISYAVFCLKKKKINKKYTIIKINKSNTQITTYTTH